MSQKNTKLSKAANARLANYQAKSTLIDSRKDVRRRDNLRAFVGIVIAGVIAVSAQAVYFNFGPGKPLPTKAPADAPAASVAENRHWTGSMTVGGQKISFDLDGTKAPKAVANFVTLAKKGFYQNLTCHRLTTSGIYVLQCGDPNGDGSGSAGYAFGPIENAPKDNVYPGGTIAMARMPNDANSMGSQFFIVYGSSFINSDTAGGYTVFGNVTQNLDAIRNIAKVGTSDGKTDGKPKNKVLLGDVTVK